MVCGLCNNNTTCAWLLREVAFVEGELEAAPPIVWPKIHIKRPEGNVVWRYGTRQVVAWMCQDPEVHRVNIKVRESAHCRFHAQPHPTCTRPQLYDGTALVTYLARDVLNSNGVLLYTVPRSHAPGHRYRIKVEDTQDSSKYEFSPAYFAILPPPAEEAANEAKRAAALEKRRRLLKARAQAKQDAKDLKEVRGVGAVDGLRCM